jgi:ABC-2 type transport system ATP-binding protein
VKARPEVLDEHILIIDKVSKSYRDTRALVDLSLDIRRATMTSIVGPDGAGKTTLVKLLCGILSPDAGRIEIEGFDFLKSPGLLKRKIGYLSQNFTLYGDLSVDENIEFFAEIHGVENYRKRRDELLEFTNLIAFRRRGAEKLSGGMKQKLALACALIHRPVLLLLDEPTTGVDPVSRREFWIILAGLLSEGMTILMTTPYMDEAERSDCVGLLYDGKLLHFGTPESLKGLLTEQYMEVVCDNVWDASRLLAGHPLVSSCDRFGDRLHVATTSRRLTEATVRALCRKAGIRVTSIRRIHPMLEDVFVSLVK